MTTVSMLDVMAENLAHVLCNGTTSGKEVCRHLCL